MALLRVDATPLLRPMRSELLALLASLAGSDWTRETSCPGWDVHAIAAHLLGVELGNVSLRRDRWGVAPAAGEDPGTWLNAFNQQWVDAMRRVSPLLLIEQLALASRRFEEYALTVDLDAPGGPVEWATGTGPAPVWLDIAREFMERYVHQHQIRQATGRPQLGAVFTAPVLVTAAHALPVALQPISRPPGTALLFVAEGDGGGSWRVTRAGSGWELDAGEPRGQPSCEIRTSVNGAIGLFVRDPGRPPPRWRGDGELAGAVLSVKAILG